MKILNEVIANLNKALGSTVNWAAYVFAFIVGYDINFFIQNDGQYELMNNVMFEVHGLLFDLLIFGVIIYKYDKRSEKKAAIEREVNLITDLREWNTQEAAIKSVRAIKNLVELGYKGVSLFKHFMANCQLKDLNLRGSDFYKTNFTRSRFDNSTLSNSQFFECDLSNINFINVVLDDVQFFNCVFDETGFINSKINKAIFSEAKLKVVGFTNSELKDANFFKADLQWAFFDKSDLTGADLRQAIVGEMDWFSKLDEWEVIGRETIKQKYKIENGVLEPHDWLDYK